MKTFLTSRSASVSRVLRVCVGSQQWNLQSEESALFCMCRSPVSFLYASFFNRGMKDGYPSRDCYVIRGEKTGLSSACDRFHPNLVIVSDDSWNLMSRLAVVRCGEETLTPSKLPYRVRLLLGRGYVICSKWRGTWRHPLKSLITYALDIREIFIRRWEI
jgi:hypothetical protein